MALRDVIAEFTIKADTKELDRAQKKTDSTANGLKAAVAAFASAELVGRIRGFVGEMVDAGDSIIDTAAQLQIGTTELQQWRLGAKLSGVETGQLDGAIKKFGLNLTEAREGAGPAADALKALGVDMKALEGRSTTDVMKEVAAGVADLGDKSQRNRLLVDLFGKQGAALGPMFEGGADGLRDLLGELEKTGGGVTEEALEAMGELGDQTDRYDSAVMSLKGRLALTFFPAITRAVTFMTNLTAAFSKSDNAATRLKSAVIVLGVAGFAAGVKMAAPYIGIAVLLGAAILIVDDLMVAMQGGDSMTGRLLDKIFGKGEGKSIFADINKDLKELGEEMGKQPGLWAKIKTAGESAGRGIANIFNTDLPEALSTLFENNSIERGWDQLQENMAIAIGKAIGEWKGKISNFITGIPETMAAFAKDLAAKAVQIGSDFVQGLIDGIKEKIKELKESVTEIGNTMIDAVKNPLSMKSPSKVGMAIGENYTDSIGMGAAAGLPGLRGVGLRTAQTIAAPGMLLASAGRAAGRNSVLANQTFHTTINGGGSVQNVKRGMLGAVSDANAALLGGLESIA